MFSKLFSSLIGNRKDSSADDMIKDMEKIVILRFRGISEQSAGKLAPTRKTSDDEILKVYRTVLSKFREAAREREEHIPVTNLNYIALMLLQMYENFGEEFFLEHLAYQISYYNQNGLREDYKRELNLF